MKKFTKAAYKKIKREQKRTSKKLIKKHKFNSNKNQCKLQLQEKILILQIII
jgi:hypothetical protein